MCIIITNKCNFDINKFCLGCYVNLKNEPTNDFIVPPYCEGQSMVCSFSFFFFGDDYNEARLKLPEAVNNTDLGTDGEDSPIKPKRRRMQVTMIYFYMSTLVCILILNKIQCFFIRQKNILFPDEDDDEAQHKLPKISQRRGKKLRLQLIRLFSVGMSRLHFFGFRFRYFVLNIS